MKEHTLNGTRLSPLGHPINCISFKIDPPPVIYTREIKFISAVAPKQAELEEKVKDYKYEFKNGRFWCLFDNCTKSFSVLPNLRRHIRSQHWRIRFNCNVEGCNSTFSKRATLKDHVRITHLNIKYNCPVSGCIARFEWAPSLHRHLRNTHNIKRQKPTDDDDDINSESNSDISSNNNINNQAITQNVKVRKKPYIIPCRSSESCDFDSSESDQEKESVN